MMACLEHECLNCGHTEFDNHAHCGGCKKCGSMEVTTFWDEADDDDPDYDGAWGFMRCDEDYDEDEEAA